VLVFDGVPVKLGVCVSVWEPVLVTEAVAVSLGDCVEDCEPVRVLVPEEVLDRDCVCDIDADALWLGVPEKLGVVVLEADRVWLADCVWLAVMLWDEVDVEDSDNVLVTLLVLELDPEPEALGVLC
jgi:hypothetical protein